MDGQADQTSTRGELSHQSTRDLPARGDLPNPAEVDAIDLNPHSVTTYDWRIVSVCGVVKVYSARDGRMVAVAPATAREIGDRFRVAMHEAADLTELRSFGEVVSRG